MRAISSMLLFIVIALSFSPVQTAMAEPFSGSVGVRAGLSPDNKDDHLREYELFAVYPLPWEWRNASGWGIATRIELSAGILYGFGDYGFIGTVGPGVSLGKKCFPVEINLGISPAFLSRDEFGDRDYNGYVQFVSHGGIDYRFSRVMGVGYRFQHMSNAGMNGDLNPGVNLHLLSLSWYLGQ